MDFSRTGVGRQQTTTAGTSAVADDDRRIKEMEILQKEITEMNLNMPVLTLLAATYRIFFVGVNVAERNSVEVKIGGSSSTFVPSYVIGLESLIKKIQPDVVSMELCSRRACQGCANEQQHKSVFHERAESGLNYMMQLIGEVGFLPGLFYYAYSIAGYEVPLVYANHILKYVISRSKVFRKDFDVHLGDRPIEITLKRLASSLSIFESIRLFVQVAISILIKPLRNQILTNVCRAIMHGNEKVAFIMSGEKALYLVASIKTAVKTKAEQGKKEMMVILDQTQLSFVMTFWNSVGEQLVPHLLSERL